VLPLAWFYISLVVFLYALLLYSELRARAKRHVKGCPSLPYISSARLDSLISIEPDLYEKRSGGIPAKLEYPSIIGIALPCLPRQAFVINLLVDRHIQSGVVRHCKPRFSMTAETPITETEIANIVERFYAKVRVDPEIGPVFNDAVRNWDAHLALLKDFWSTVLLTTGRYKGNPLLAHFPLPIEEKYFARWLKLFSETAKEVVPASQAAIIMRKADLIAMNMKRVLASRR
jgi:hemoglobin